MTGVQTCALPISRAYYSTMYGYDLTDADLAELLEGALPKGAQ